MMKKVLVYKSALLPISETFIKEQVRSLSNWKGILVGRKLVKNGIPLNGLDLIFLKVYRYKLLRIAANLLNIACDFRFSSTLQRLKAEKADLLHIHFGVEAVAFWPIASRLDLPVLITLHGLDINIYRESFENGSFGRVMKSYPSQLLEIAHDSRTHFLAVSHSIKRRAIEYGIPEHKITVSYIGVDTDRFKPSSMPIIERTKVLFVGRLVEKKGCRYLIEAFSRIQSQFPKAELVIIGSGPMQLDLQDFAIEQDVRALFLGALDNQQVQRYLAEARVFCLPSITASNGDAEGLPIVILEAQSCGVPVITSARGGDEGIVHEVTGYVHKEKDVETISRYLIKLLSDDKLLESFSIHARKNAVEKMDIHDATEKLENIYNFLLKQ